MFTVLGNGSSTFEEWRIELVDEKDERKGGGLEEVQ